MYNKLLNYYFPSSTNLNLSYEKQIENECEKFLPEVYDTWTYIHKLSTDTTHFREIYDLYKYERSETEQKSYLNQLKTLDDNIYKLTLTIRQRLEYLEKLVQPILEQYHHHSQENENNNTNYIPAYIRIVQNQLNSLKLSFQRILTKHNSDTIDYQNDLKQFVEISKEKIQNFVQNNSEEEQIQTQIQLQILTEQEKEIIDLETRLESLKILNDRVRQMK